MAWNPDARVRGSSLIYQRSADDDDSADESEGTTMPFEVKTKFSDSNLSQAISTSKPRGVVWPMARAGPPAATLPAGPAGERCLTC